MIKCYMVLINLGFGGEIFFQKKENAEYFIKTIKDNYIISVQPYYGGFSYSFCYQPTKNVGSSCQCFFSRFKMTKPKLKIL